MDFTPFILYMNQNKNKKRGNKAMPQIIAPPEHEFQFDPIVTTCPHCHYTISYTVDEVERVDDEHMGIYCPHCQGVIETEDVEPFTFPNTFFHFGTNEGAVCLSDKEVQSYVDIVKRKLQQELEVGEYIITGTGDTMVFGLKFEDEDVIYVAKNYWEESIYRNN